MPGPLTWLMQRAEATKRRLNDFSPERLEADVENILADYKEDPLSLVGPHVGGLGIIRKGGMPGLNAWTEIDEDRLINALAMTRRGELDSPSMYVAKGGPKYTFGNMALVARPDAVDPIRRPGMLYNRDAWTPMLSDFESNTHPYNRLRNRLSHAGYDDYRLKHPVNHVGHQLMIDQSPKFTSFKDFENSPYGAGVLMSTTRESNLPKGWSELLSQKAGLATVKDRATKLNIPHTDRAIEELMSPESTVAKEVVKLEFPQLSNLIDDWGKLNDRVRYRQFAKAVPTSHDAKEILQFARSAPSTYGELKVSGPLSITRENFLAAIPKNPSTVDNLTIEALKRRGIPVINPNQASAIGGEQGLVDIMNRLTEESVFPFERAMIYPNYDHLFDGLD